jgi:hypothetical protein
MPSQPTSPSRFFTPHELAILRRTVEELWAHDDALTRRVLRSGYMSSRCTYRHPFFTADGFENVRFIFRLATWITNPPEQTQLTLASVSETNSYTDHRAQKASGLGAEGGRTERINDFEDCVLHCRIRQVVYPRFLPKLIGLPVRDSHMHVSIRRAKPSGIDPEEFHFEIVSLTAHANLIRGLEVIPLVGPFWLNFGRPLLSWVGIKAMKLLHQVVRPPFVSGVTGLD